MGTAYKIRCKHCGAQFDHSAHPSYGLLPACVGCGEYVETEEFNEQVEVTYIWD